MEWQIGNDAANTVHKPFRPHRVELKWCYEIMYLPENKEGPRGPFLNGGSCGGVLCYTIIPKSPGPPGPPCGRGGGVTGVGG